MVMVISPRAEEKAPAWLLAQIWIACAGLRAGSCGTSTGKPAADWAPATVVLVPPGRGPGGMATCVQDTGPPDLIRLVASTTAAATPRLPATASRAITLLGARR